ncbi:MAG: aldehyde dehydrogenase family protein, partial [Actinobacteria bacterium]|nr:aldehyde dehydrogenase family protein [Actinomycetota bacterium]
MYIAGSFVESNGIRVPVIDPATEQTVGQFASATPTEVDDAVAAARAAQREWWRMSALERAEALHRVADRLNEMAPIVGECLTREMG